MLFGHIRIFESINLYKTNNFKFVIRIICIYVKSLVKNNNLRIEIRIKLKSQHN